MPAWFSFDIICLVLIVLKGVGNLLDLLGCCSILWNVYRHNHRLTIYNEVINNLPLVNFLFITPLFAFFNVIFLLILWRGIRQRRPKYVKAYFVYSVAVTILVTSIFVVIQTYCDPLQNGEFQYEVLHVMFLALVYLKYSWMADEARGLSRTKNF